MKTMNATATISEALNGLDALKARVTVYVPATVGTSDAADNAREVDSVAAALSAWFGGATIQPRVAAGCLRPAVSLRRTQQRSMPPVPLNIWRRRSGTCWSSAGISK